MRPEHKTPDTWVYVLTFVYQVRLWAERMSQESVVGLGSGDAERKQEEWETEATAPEPPIAKGHASRVCNIVLPLHATVSNTQHRAHAT